MAANKDQSEAAKPVRKPSRRAFIVAPVLFLCSAGGGFFALNKGILPLFSGKAVPEDAAESFDKDIAFIPLEPILINLGGSDSGRFLRFQGQVEVTEISKAEVTSLIPRLMDVLNGYLRAVDTSMLEDRTALVRLKGQMLRRIQMVVGSGKVRDLLVMEFVVS